MESDSESSHQLSRSSSENSSEEDELTFSSLKNNDRATSIRNILRETTEPSYSYSFQKASNKQHKYFGEKNEFNIRSCRSKTNYNEKSSEDNEEASSSDEKNKKNKKSSDLKSTYMRQSLKSWQQSASEDEDDEQSNDSESDASLEYARKKKKKITNINKRTIQRLTNTISYKEESDASTDDNDIIEASKTTKETRDDCETIEKVIRQRVGAVGATGSKTVSYVVTEEGDPNELLKGGATEVQYLIKWKNWAHIHNSWESDDSLDKQKADGMKRLVNFTKKGYQINYWKKHASLDELEMHACEEEAKNEMLASHCKVDRIIKQKANGDYLVKWENLSYSQCTEEDGTLVEKLFPKAIEDFQFRLLSSRTPNKYCRALKSRPKFVPLKEQPSSVGGAENFQLRDYQLDGLNWLLHAWTRGNSVILADEMGLGKTIQTISFLSSLMEMHEVYGPFLLVVPLSTVTAWNREFYTWAPHINVVEYLGDVESRNMIRKEEWNQPGCKKLKFNVLLTTYEILLKDKSVLSGISWAVLGIDEAHRLKNEDSLLYRSLITFDSNHRLLITGTPLQNSLKELWALLHFLMPTRYDSWDDFESEHSAADKTGFQKLHHELEPFLLRRIKKDVEKSLPSKVEQILRVEMSKIQKQYYKWILTKNYQELCKDSHGKVTSFINLIMELKKCCNHAFLVRSPDSLAKSSLSKLELLVKSSGKLILLDKLLLRLKEAGHRVLIFSQMVRMLDILAEYLQLRHFPFQRLDGSIRSELRRQAMDHFNAEGSSDFCFLLSTRAGGLGVNLATADTVIIYDSDWNPQNDLQAQARAHRIGQKSQVSVYRLVTKTSVEEDILERAKKKMVLDHLVIQRMDTTGSSALLRPDLIPQSNAAVPFNKEELNAILKFGAEDLFKDSDDDDNESQVDIDDILRMAEMRNTDDLKNSVTDELLSQFKVVSFENLEDEELEGKEATRKEKSWDEIIPESERRKIADQEMHERILQNNPLPRSRKRNILDSENNANSAHKRLKKGKSYANEDAMKEDQDAESEDVSDEVVTAKKRGRPRSAPQQVDNFSHAELRRLVKSLKKFARPLERLDAILKDADLEDKLIEDISTAIQYIIDTSLMLISNLEDQDTKDDNRPLTFKLLKVTINARAIIDSCRFLEPLAIWKSINMNGFPPKMNLKAAYYDCEWTEVDDMHLMSGVYQHGFGNWEAIKKDKKLQLGNKILQSGEKRPQMKHLLSRVEYILRGLHKHSKHLTKAAKLEKQNEKEKQKLNNKDKKTTSKEKSTKTDKPIKIKNEKINDKIKNEKVIKEVEKSSKEMPKVEKKIFITELEKEELNDDSITEDIHEDIFKECKEKMRPVKRALKKLGGGSADSPQRHLENTRKCLLEIGDHVTSLLVKVSEVQDMKNWRCHLWTFVSKFTEFNAKRLYKLYKHMVKKRQAVATVDQVATVSSSGIEFHDATSSASHLNKYDDYDNEDEFDNNEEQVKSWKTKSKKKVIKDKK